VSPGINRQELILELTRFSGLTATVLFYRFNLPCKEFVEGKQGNVIVWGDE